VLGVAWSTSPALDLSWHRWRPVADRSCLIHLELRQPVAILTPGGNWPRGGGAGRASTVGASHDETASDMVSAFSACASWLLVGERGTLGTCGGDSAMPGKRVAADRKRFTHHRLAHLQGRIGLPRSGSPAGRGGGVPVCARF
jgi:hypothetical protein